MTRSTGTVIGMAAGALPLPISCSTRCPRTLSAYSSTESGRTPILRKVSGNPRRTSMTCSRWPWHHHCMRRLVSLGLLGALVTGAFGCGLNEDHGPVEPGAELAAAGDVRFSLPTTHRVVVERRTTDGWSDAHVVFEDPGRECGMVHAIAAGSTVAATVDCDKHFSVDQMPTRSVALISADGRSWAHRDLDGEAYGTPGLSPEGGHAVWVQADDLLTWEAGSFGSAPQPTGSAQVVTVDDRGTILAIAVGTSAGQCSVEVRTNEADIPQVVVPIAGAGELPCRELGMALAQPREIQGDLSGQPGTEFVVRNTSAGGWVLTVRPPVVAPGLDVYADDPAIAIWNQVTINTQGDLVAVGSPDRQHITAQHYDRARQRWTPSRVVHIAAAPTCRRRIADSGVLQGATFRLRLICDDEAIVLHSRTGTTWSK